MNSSIGHKVEFKPAEYAGSVIDNQGADPDYPVERYPVLVFFRCLSNPLASVWRFCESRPAAESFLAAERSKGGIL